MEKKTTIIVLSGFSGAGKDFIISELIDSNNKVSLVKSCTTRAPRKGDNNKYTYLTKEEFERAIKRNEFLEYNLYGDQYYGTPYEGENGLNSMIEKSEIVVIEVDYKGMQDIKKSEFFRSPHYIFHTVFIATSVKSLIRRLVERKTENLAQIIKRLEVAQIEANHIKEYDYLILNEKCVEHSAADDIKKLIAGTYIDKSLFLEKEFNQDIKKHIERLKKFLNNQVVKPEEENHGFESKM